MMNKDTKTRWLKALRSRGYQQTRGTLKRRPAGSTRATYCCLGVLCQLTDKKAWTAGEVGDNSMAFEYAGTLETGGLSRPLRIELGLTDKQCNKLISLNDKKEQSFKQIADYVEKHIPAKESK